MMGAAKLIRFAVLISFAGLFGWLFYIRYWSYRDCIEAAQSSCVTPSGDNLIGGGAFWIIPAIAFALLAVLTLQKRR
jgi:hypothetical protein